jgi:hypothetical protein
MTKRKRFMSLHEGLKDIPWFEVEGHIDLSPRGKTPKFTGPLSEPIVVPKDPAAENVEKATKEISATRMGKLRLLQDHFFGRRSEDWFALSFRLACAYVPGFKIARRGRGAPSKWMYEPAVEVVVAIEKLILGDDLTVPAAITKLKLDPKWKAKLKTFNEARYYEAIAHLEENG